MLVLSKLSSVLGRSMQYESSYVSKLATGKIDLLNINQIYLLLILHYSNLEFILCTLKDDNSSKIKKD